MTRRIKRAKEWELTLVIKEDSFIRPPRDFQRNALLNKAMKDFSDDLKSLDQSAEAFVPGNLNSDFADRTQTELTDEEIMEDWQIPLMQAMADIAAESKGAVLEIGFGRGIASAMVQEHAPKSHTIIECNQSVIQRFHEWKQAYEGSEIHIVEGLWQDTIDALPQYDSILFHTYPLNEEEYMEYVNKSTTFAEHFFEVAAQHLRPGGIFTYMTNEIDSLSREHQRSLFKHFSEISLQVLPLNMPDDVKDTWWADKMVVIKAIK